MSTFVLRPWQQVVVDHVEEHENYVDTEQMQTLSEYERAKASRIQAAFPRGSGHTTLAAYLAAKYPSALIYTDTEHYKELSVTAACLSKDLSLKLNFDNCNAMSAFHVYHDLMVTSKSSWETRGLGRLKLKFGQKVDEPRVSIVDNATLISETHPEIVDWVFQVSTGPVVLLG